MVKHYTNEYDAVGFNCFHNSQSVAAHVYSRTKLHIISFIMIKNNNAPFIRDNDRARQNCFIVLLTTMFISRGVSHVHRYNMGVRQVKQLNKINLINNRNAVSNFYTRIIPLRLKSIFFEIIAAYDSKFAFKIPTGKHD